MAGAEVGSQGTITIATRGPGGPGEVELAIAGGTETFTAYSDESLEVGTAVLVLEVRGGRKVDVTPAR